jgi:hypothetical protein
MLCTMMTKKVVAIAILLGLLAGPAQAFPGQAPPAIELTVERLACTVTRTVPPAGKGGIIVFVKVPSDSKLKSATLKTTSGELPLEVTPAVSLTGEYETIIDSEAAKCAASGNVVLEVEGEFEANTISCPEVPLFKPSACAES